MSQRKSGYERKPGDGYQTPRWPVEVLIPHLRAAHCKIIWEPACGEGNMVATLSDAGFSVIATDILQGIDFLLEPGRASVDAIVTNPPFLFAQKFIEHAISISTPGVIIAMLLRTDYDHAKSRRHLFKDCPHFYKTVKLLSRITWFEPATASPSQNHAWFLWKIGNKDAPKMEYGSQSTIDYGP